MKRNKKIGILLAAFACISVAAFGVTRYEEQKELIKNSDDIILEVASEEVKAFSWECDKGEFAFHRDENGRWRYDEDEAFPVDEERLGMLLAQFQEFGVSFIIEKVEDWGQYGLDTPVCTIHMETEEASYEILLGDYSAMDAERYVSVGDGNAYLVKNDPLDQFAIEISDLILHDEIPELWDVTQLQVAGKEPAQIIYEEGGTNSYFAEDVYYLKQEERYLPLDTMNVNDYLNTIRNLNLKEYTTYNASQEELVSCGLDTPVLSISIDYTITDEETEEEKTENFVLHVGRDPAEQIAGAEEKEEADQSEDTIKSTMEEEQVTAFARVGESKIIYQITSEQYQKLMDMSYDSLRHQELFWGDFNDIYRLDITLEDVDYTIASEQKEEKRIYYYRGEEVEMAGIRSTIGELTAQSFIDETPAQKEEISLTIYLDNEEYPKVQIQLYRYDGNSCIAVVDEEPVAFVERTKVVDLIEAVNAIVLDSVH